MGIHESQNYKSIPIITQTAGAFKEEHQKCIEAGMDDFIIKPIDPNRINEILDKYLKA
jgi:CheY-like chemotaxis protein